MRGLLDREVTPYSREGGEVQNMSASKPPQKDQTDMLMRVRLMRTGYLTILALLFLLVVFTPHLIKGSFKVRESFVVRQEILESLLIAGLLVLGYLISALYRKQLNTYLKRIDELTIDRCDLEDRLEEAFKYIGQVNVQLQEIRSVFSGLKTYPQSRNDLRKILSFFAQKVLGIVKVDWVLFRIINPEKLRTLHEYSEARASALLLKPAISNRAIVDNEAIVGCAVIGSDQESVLIKVFCVFPTTALTTHQKILIKAMVNQLEMLFIIFTSKYYRESNSENIPLEKLIS
jgi:hypothetical protein